MIADLPIAGELPGDQEITGIAYDSRRVSPGDLFAALVGERFDGRDFADGALAAGAVAVLAAGPSPRGLERRWLETPDPRAVLGPLAARLWGHPDRELVMAAVTGTNGKSTVVALLAAILEAADRPAGALGTLGYRFRDLELPAEHTTPEASDLFRILRRMRDAGARAVVMEVSSHALDRRRVEGASFDVAIFTNLTRDHLDYHRDWDGYFAAKRRLFGQLKEGGRPVVNASDPYGRRLATELPGALTYGANGDIRVAESDLRTDGIRAILSTPRGELEISSPLVGAFNLENLLAAVAAAEALELPHAAVAAACARRGPLPGRMEPVDLGQEFPVFVDYAHTDAALEAALRSVKAATGRKVILVFGCGGDRDPGKRPLMGRVAGELAELPIVTSDNPRREEPLAIIGAVEEGLKQSGNPAYRVVPDRREAIRRAISVADAEWAVLVAGKGHERVQIVGEQETPFSDREEIAAALEERLGREAGR